jgi:hypothetical protein
MSKVMVASGPDVYVHIPRGYKVCLGTRVAKASHDRLSPLDSGRLNLEVGLFRLIVM